MMIRSQKLCSVILALCLCAVVPLNTSCDGKTSLAKTAEAAKDIGANTRSVIKAVGQAYQQNLITLEQKDKLADILGTIAVGGQKGVDAIEFLHKQGIETPTTEQRIKLTDIFDNEVVGPFLTLLTEIGKLTDTQATAIRISLASLRTTMLLLANRLGRNDIIRAIKAREVWNV